VRGRLAARALNERFVFVPYADGDPGNVELIHVSLDFFNQSIGIHDGSTL
jgi:hypothetical protein